MKKSGRNYIYPVERIRQWIGEGKTQEWIGNQLDVPSRLIQKVCKKHGIQCQRTGPRNGPGHPDWKGGRLIDKNGYILLYCPGHPFARKPRRAYVPEHRLVMEKHIERYLHPWEVVHHLNGDKKDNRIENLRLYESNGQHLHEELSGRCPDWTPDGRERIQAAIHRVGEIRRGLTLDEYRNRKEPLRSTDERQESVAAAS
jgi:hypothetical protein